MTAAFVGGSDWVCPMCLSPVGGEVVRVLCPDHPPARVLPRGRLSADDLLCDRCDSHNRVGSRGLFVQHFGCEMTEPFWDAASSELRVPAELYYDRQTDKGSVREKVGGHWQLDFMRSIAAGTERLLPRGYEPTDAVWFPASMLLATRAIEPHVKNAVTIAIKGPRRAGKSVLAAFATTRVGYPVGSAFRFRNDFVYEAPIGARGDSINPELRRSRMAWALGTSAFLNHGRRHIALFEGSRVGPGNIRAGFFTSDESHVERSSGPARRARRWLRDRRVIGPTIVKIEEWLGREHPLRALIAYDTAGEEFRHVGGNEFLDRLERAVDVVGIVIEAAQIAQPPAADTDQLDGIAYCLSHLENLVRGPGQRVCLMVTKMDTVVGIDELRRLARKPKRDRQSWVMKNLNGSGRHQRVLEDFQSRLKELDEVFFFAVEGFDGQASPQAYGIDEFTKWCFLAPPDDTGG